MNVNMNKKCSRTLSIDNGSMKQFKSPFNFGDKSANKAFQSEGKNNFPFLEFGDEEKNVQNDRKFYALTSKNFNKDEGFNHSFFEQEKSKFISEKIQMPAFLKQPQAVNKLNSFEQKQHSVSFFEPKSENHNKIFQKFNEDPNKYSYKILQKNIEEQKLLNQNILKKYEIKDKGFEKIIEENDKKKEIVQDSFVSIQKKDSLERENFKLRIENKNLKKTCEDLKEDIKHLTQKIHNLDLLSDKDRTIGENSDLKKSLQMMGKEIDRLKQEQKQSFEKIYDLTAANNAISEMNFSMEDKLEKAAKEKQAIESEYTLKIKFFINENKALTSIMEKKERDQREAEKESKNMNFKMEEDLKILLQSHKDFSFVIDKFAKKHHKNSNN